MKKILGLGLCLLTSLLWVTTVLACESCTISRLGKDQSAVRAQTENGRFYFEYLYEQKDWKKMSAEEAHELHHDGHHVHLRSTEDLYHFKIGSQVNENLQIFADLPYVVRNTVEIEDHDRVGQKEVSKGIGDLNIIGDYRFWKKTNQSLSAAFGVKVPTGETRVLNSAGDRFEPELQPGTGSVDYLLGGIYRRVQDRSSLVGNISYLIKNEGAQDLKGSDVLTSALYWEYLVNPKSSAFKFYPGVDFVYQYETKQETAGEEIADSGGTTFLSGPSFRIEAHDRVSVLGAVLFPVSQNLGGVHQELNLEWNLGGQLKF